jgi:hypothetical protein
MEREKREFVGGSTILPTMSDLFSQSRLSFEALFLTWRE